MEPETLAIFGTLVLVALLVAAWGLDTAFCRMPADVPSGIAGKSMTVGYRMHPWR